MSEIPNDLRYTKDHEWARQRGDLIEVGITAYAVEQLGDVTLVDLPAAGTPARRRTSASATSSPSRP